MRRWIGVVTLGALTACGAAEPVAVVPAPNETPQLAEGEAEPSPSAQPQARWSETCETRYREVLAAIEVSQQRPCHSNAECATVTNPGHPTRELRLVVHRSDAAGLETRSEMHLSSCGARLRHEAIEEAFRHVETRCRGDCTAEVTTFHPEPLD